VLAYLETIVGRAALGQIAAFLVLVRPNSRG
jgi:hypothetical protein